MLTGRDSLCRGSGQVGGIFLFILFLLVVHPKLSSLVGTPAHASHRDTAALRIGPHGTFKIAIFSDLHFGEEEHGWGIDQDINTTRVMRSVLDTERPDLVVLNGDLVTGENTFRENSSDYIHQIVVPMVERGIPWASTYGNHDSQFNLSRQGLLHQEAKYSLSLTRMEDDSLPGVTNYWLSVYNGSVAVAVLWFLDSRGGCPFQPQPGEQDYINDWVATETVDWFKKNSYVETRRGHIPSLVFTHIPPHVYRQAQLDSIDPSRFPGLHEDNPLDHQGKGLDDEVFVQALRDTPNLHSIYTGHDHGDSWCSAWPISLDNRPRPFLCFAKHTGYGGYGKWNRGARIIELGFSNNQFQVLTWVRMESGSVITKVALNETYGQDEYPGETGEDG